MKRSEVKEGQLYVMASGSTNSGFPKGSILLLDCDDNTDFLCFRRKDGKSTPDGELLSWERLSTVEPYVEPKPETTQTTDELIAENVSLAEQVVRLAAQDVALREELEKLKVPLQLKIKELGAKIDRKRGYFDDNAKIIYTRCIGVLGSSLNETVNNHSEVERT